MKELQPKTLLILILSLGATGLVLGLYQLSRSLQSPFAELVDTEAETENVRNQLLALRERDTDKDSLSDFDELKLYHTSPYLADSDSDGVPDNTEIASGQDPNCPSGKVCRSQPSNTNYSDELANLYNVNQNSNTNTVNNAAPANQTVNPPVDQVPIDTLRSALKGAGVPAETVDSFSDAELRTLYAEALAEEQGNANAASNSNQAPANANTEVTLTDLQSLTPAEIRELMIASGVPAEQLNLIDDATLKAIFDESLKEINQQ